MATVQDLGRPAWRSSGVPLSGAADVLSHHIANALVGNDDSAATLEVVGGGWKARVEQGGWAAHFGAGGTLWVDGVEAERGRTLFLPTGAMLHIRATAEGNFSYFSTAGGWAVPEVLGSRSTCLAAGFGGLDGRPLQAGDALHSYNNRTSNLQLPTSCCGKAAGMLRCRAVPPKMSCAFCPARSRAGGR